MFTTLALCIVPALQGGAALHSHEAAVFIELPEVQEFVQAWQSSALPSILADDSLADSLALAGLPDLSDLGALLELLPAEAQRDVLPLLKGIRSVSFSAQVELSELESVVQNAVVAYQVHTQLQTLRSAVMDTRQRSGSLPASLESMGLSEAERLDPFGNPVLYTVAGEGFELASLGADGERGGTGLASDWDSSSRFPPYIVAQVANLVGAELVVEWNDPAVAERVAGMAGLYLDRLANELPFAELTDFGGDARFPSRAFSVQPSDVGVPGVATTIDFGLLMGPTRSALVIGRTKASDVARRMAALEAGAPAEDSLAASETFQQSMTRVQRDAGTVFWQGAVRDFGPLPEGDSVGEALGKVGQFFSLLGFQSGAWQTRLVEGKYITDAYLIGQAGAGDLSAVAALVPDDAVLMSAGKVDPLGVWRLLKGVVKVNGEEPTPESLRELIGLDLEGDLLANLGSQYATWFLPVNGLAPPSAFFVTPVKDADRVMASLDKLADLLVKVDDEFRVSRRPYKGINYTTLDVGVPIGFRPSFCVIDDMLWLSNSSTLLKRTIRMHSKGDMGARGAHPLFVSLLDESGSLPGNLESVFYADTGSMLAAYYGAGRSFAGMIPSDVGVPPGLIESLPEPDIFTRHLPPAFSWTRFEDGVLMTHKEGAFGPEPFVVGAIAGFSAAFLSARVFDDAVVTREVLPPPEPVASDENTEATRAAIQAIELGLLVYSLTNSDYPTELEALLETTSAYPQGYLGADSLPLDGWGRPFVFARVSADAYTLYSVGPNGSDEGGTGDDIRAE